MEYSSFAPETQGIVAPLSPCPITPDDLKEVRELRRAMVDRGYDRTIAEHSPWSTFVAPNGRGKHPLTEIVNGEKQPWTKGHSHWRLKRVTPYSANTGSVLGGEYALTALDVDPNKTATAADQVAFTRDLLQLIYIKCPESKAALLRLRDPASVLLLLRASQAMTKLIVAGERGKLELLGEGQQFVVHGWHPRSLDGPPVRWYWRRDQAPWNTPIGDLVVVSTEKLTELMEYIAASGVLGPPVVRGATTTTVVAGRRHRASQYPATDRLGELIKKHNQLIIPAAKELIEEVGKAGHGRHDALVAICGRLIYQRWPHQRAADWLTPIVNDAFDDGDWTDEVEAALNHAEKRQKERAGGVKSVVWEHNTNV